MNLLFIKRRLQFMQSAGIAESVGILTEDLQNLQTESGDNIKQN